MSRSSRASNLTFLLPALPLVHDKLLPPCQGVFHPCGYKACLLGDQVLHLLPGILKDCVDGRLFMLDTCFEVTFNFPWWIRLAYWSKGSNPSVSKLMCLGNFHLRGELNFCAAEFLVSLSWILIIHKTCESYVEGRLIDLLEPLHMAVAVGFAVNCARHFNQCACALPYWRSHKRVSQLLLRMCHVS